LLKNLYIIAGCNGAGKTTASFSILPEMLECKEFVNADEIAKGLSPFQPEKVAIEAGRIMLDRISELIKNDEVFAFETTLASRTFQHTVKLAQSKGYNVVLLYFWLQNVDLAIARVKNRVKEGGHNIPTETIIRRYKNGIKNLFEIYMPIVDELMIFDNSNDEPIIIAEKEKNGSFLIIENDKFAQLSEFLK